MGVMRVRPLEERLRDATGATSPEELKAVQDSVREHLITALLEPRRVPTIADSGYLKYDAKNNITDYFTQSGMDLTAYGGIGTVSARLYDAFCKDALKQVQYGIANGGSPAALAIVGTLDPWEAAYFLTGNWSGKSAKNPYYRFSRKQLEGMLNTKDSAGTWQYHPLMAVISNLIGNGKQRMEWVHENSRKTSTKCKYPDFYDADAEPRMPVEQWRRLGPQRREPEQLSLF